MERNKRGRPAASRNVRVTPEFRDEPDIAKLTRVLLLIAQKLAEDENAAKQAESDGWEGDAVA